MQSTFSILFYQRKDKINADGKASINVRITIGGDYAYFSSKTSIDPKLWNPKTKRATGKSDDAVYVNNMLDNIEHNLRNKYLELTKYGDIVTPDMLRDELLGKSAKSNTLLKLFSDFIERQEKLIGKDITESTFSKFVLTYRRLEEFLKIKRNRDDIPLHLIDHGFVTDFHTFLKVDHGLSINSSEKLVRIFKRITTYAFKSGLSPRDPFALHTIKKEKKDRGYLTADELQRIKDYHTVNDRLQRVRDLFIFCCYTGVDYSTLASLTEDNLIMGDKGLSIITNRIKTGVRCEIFLLPDALAILKKYENQRSDRRLLPVISNTNYNLYLKEIAQACRITKRVTSHLARHTFASTVCLKNGVSIGAIQKMLGHTKQSTTNIYARIMDSTVADEMDQLARKLSEPPTPEDSKPEPPASKFTPEEIALLQKISLMAGVS